MKALCAGLLAAGALVLGTVSSPAGAARAASPHHLLGLVRHVAPTSGLAPARAASTAAGINCIATCSSYEATINQYFTDVAADNGLSTNVYSVTTQYSGIQYAETFAGPYVDTNPFPAGPSYLTCNDHVDKYCVTDQQLEDEIAKVVAKNHLPLQSQTALYMIFTPASVGVCYSAGTPDPHANPCTTNAFCAYHAQAPHFIYAVVADAAAIPGGFCNAGEAPAGNAADATINLISHEQIEAITDPNVGGGWFAGDGRHEIADLCSWDFGAPVGPAGAEYNQVINTHKYFVQLEYSNADSGCVPYLGGPVTAPDPRDGIGPLTDHADSVMTTNTVYPIYWVPAAPVNTTLPTISGTPKVGKTLKALHGIWSNLPKFTYRWLRCSAAAAACKPISMATKPTYTLVAADKGHRIEVRVTGTNMVGQTSASSSPTISVRS